MELNQKHIDVAIILVDTVNKGEPIYYEYLRQKVNLGMIELWRYLGDLSIYSFNHNMPLISAVVVSQEHQIPGNAFYESIYYPCKNIHAKTIDEKLEVYISEFKLIQEYTNWNELLELLNTDVYPKVNRLKKKPFKRMNTTTTTTSLPKSEGAVDIDVETIYEEGKKRLETHITKERSSKLIPHAKEQFKEKYGHLFCELCGFDFEEFYGELGKDFIEGHHIKPISDMKKIHFSTTKDIMMLCPNCHEMVHRGIRNNMSFDDIKSYINNKAGKGRN